MKYDNGLTIIVPAYNSSETIERCIDSLLKYSNGSNIIVINDGSTDDTSSKLKKYKDKENITIITKINGGVSAARNDGIKLSKTKYICFVDSDDEVTQNFSQLNYILQTDLSDLIVFGHTYIDESTSFDYIPESIINKDMSLFLKENNLVQFNTFLQYPWAKIYSKDILEQNEIFFDVNYSYGEDTLFIYEYLKHVSNISFYNITIYNYFNILNSLSKNNDLNEYYKFNDINDKIKDIFNKKLLEVDNSLFYFRTRFQILEMINIIYSTKYENKKKKFQDYKSLLSQKRVKDSFVSNHNTTFKNKFINFLVKNENIRLLNLFIWIRKFPKKFNKKDNNSSS